MDKRTVIYYEDELNDEFSVAQITPRVIDGSYIYCHDNVWKKFTHFFWYRMVATPIAWLYTKLVFGHRIVGADVLKPYRHRGFFFYGNHTQDIADAFIPNMAVLPKTAYVVVHPNNVSMPYLWKVTPSMGALPLPDDMAAYRNFLAAVERRYRENHALVIYPEAHIWPYYTGIRNFPDKSFHYPVKLDAPCFCFTNTYQKRRFSKEPRIVTYIDGPFFPNKDLPAPKRKQELRDRIYETMCRRARLSTDVRIQYIRKEDQNG